MAFLQLDRIRRPWAVPAVAVVAVAAVAVAPHVLAHAQHPDLPTRTPTQLLTAIGSTKVQALSGKVDSTPHLGLPQLPGSNGGNLLTTVFTGPSTWTLAIDGADRQKVSLLGTGQETDVIRNGSSVWTWDSASQSASHYTLPAHHDADGAADAPTGPAGTTASPMTIAAKIVAAISPTTRLHVGPTTVVAGRSAYTLVVSPRTSGSLVGRAVIDVDSATGLPLGVQIYPTGSGEAAISEQFSSISLTTPASSTFDFTPPADATVHTHSADSHHHGWALAGHRSWRHDGWYAHSGPVTPSTSDPTARPHVVGTGWAAVAVFPSIGAAGASLGSMGPAHLSGSSMLQALTSAGPDGSRLLQTRLLTVLITKQGSVLVGAVPAARLESLARSGA